MAKKTSRAQLPRNRFVTEREKLVMRRMANDLKKPYSQAEIGEAFNVSQSTVSRAIRDVTRATVGGRGGVSPATARANKERNAWCFAQMRKVLRRHPTSVTMKFPTLTQLARALKEHPKVRAGKWTAIGGRQLDRVFRGAGWRYVKRQTVQAYTDKHVQQRKDFAATEWPAVKSRRKLQDRARFVYCFQDESLFQLYSHTQDSYMWVPPGMKPYNVLRTRSSGKDKTMCFLFLMHDKLKVFFHKKLEGDAAYEVVNGRRRKKKDTVNRFTLIRDALKPMAKLLKGKTLYWDNASQHISRDVKKWLREHQVKVQYGPPLSPDLNPCEHVFGVLKAKVGARYPKSVAELQRFIKEEAAALEPIARRFCLKFESALEACFKNKGMPGNAPNWGK